MKFTNIFAAAHCILQKHEINPISSPKILAIFGVYRLNDPYEVERVSLRPEKIIIHEDWDPEAKSYDADIALLKFEEGKLSIYHVYITPICIWDSSEKPTVDKGFVLSWGRSEDDSKSHEMIPMLVSAPIITNEDCILENKAFLELSSHRTFCAGLRNGSGICYGDSGSGLFIKVDGVHYLKGIVSNSLFDYYGCDVYSNAIYTNVFKFTDWIKQKTRRAFATSTKGEKF